MIWALARTSVLVLVLLLVCANTVRSLIVTPARHPQAYGALSTASCAHSSSRVHHLDRARRTRKLMSVNSDGEEVMADMTRPTVYLPLQIDNRLVSSLSMHHHVQRPTAPSPPTLTDPAHCAHQNRKREASSLVSSLKNAAALFSAFAFG